MYFKRFAQLFVIFFVAGGILAAIFATNFTGNRWLTFLVALVVAYLVLVLPLVILTIAKAKKKENIVGVQSENGELARILKTLPGYIALSVLDDENGSATTIMSFTQATNPDEENVLYMVSDPATTKVKQLREHAAVSFTTWFDDVNGGARLSSNRTTAEVFEGEANKALIEREPNILAIHENAAGMAIIKLTIHSALYENFKDGLKVLQY